ncbi:hypothetical protein C7M84_022305 [Penaeus vannamei]|uniref:Uncharacterized protein n=1 Tax=Penaeus vannamei TaxID=6689 RepID=A0A423U770_PENVA|nr:hypothetical protein C7M84_022305 [Penaeus vannamei]
MHCVDRASREPLPVEHLAVCLQYSTATGYGDESGSMDYLHSWAPITLWAVVVALLLLPRLAVVCASTSKAKPIFLDQFGNARPHQEVYLRLKANLGTFDGLYLKAVCIAVWAIMAQVFVVLAINVILLPGKVLPILMGFPWHRDVEKYADPISVAFLSFLSCTITSYVHLQSLRRSYYGCYHSMATFYLGLFFVIGIAMLALFTITFLHLLHLVLCLPTPCGRRHLVNRGRIHDEVNGLPLRPGDLLMLEYGKQYVSGRDATSSGSSSSEEELSVVVAKDPVVLKDSASSAEDTDGLFTSACDQILVEGRETAVGFVAGQSQVLADAIQVCETAVEVIPVEQIHGGENQPLEELEMGEEAGGERILAASQKPFQLLGFYYLRTGGRSGPDS